MTRGGDTRGRIKAEAMQLFVARGVDNISVRDIADAVGMKPSNLYAHFSSREELVREMFAEGYAEYGQVLDATTALPGFERRLRAMVELICRLHDRDTTRFRFLLLSQHAALHGEAAPHLADATTPVAVIERAVQEAMRAGEIPHGDAALVTAMIVGAVLQVAAFRLYGRLDQPLTAMQDRIAEACLAIASPLSVEIPSAFHPTSKAGDA